MKDKFLNDIKHTVESSPPDRSFDPARIWNRLEPQLLSKAKARKQNRRKQKRYLSAAASLLLLAAAAALFTSEKQDYTLQAVIPGTASIEFPGIEKNSSALLNSPKTGRNKHPGINDPGDPVSAAGRIAPKEPATAYIMNEPFLQNDPVTPDTLKKAVVIMKPKFRIAHINEYGQQPAAVEEKPGREPVGFSFGRKISDSKADPADPHELPVKKPKTLMQIFTSSQ